jgi:putative phosphoribosyl transferase
MQIPFVDRIDAGRQLAARLRDYANRADVIVLALPRGGVPVAYEVAAALNAPLDVLNVRKLGMPDQPELAIGAIATGGVRVLNQSLIDETGVTPQEIEEVAAAEERELQRREWAYREGRLAPELTGRTVILVDDGLATGSTMAAAIEAVRARGAAGIVVAVPVGPADTCAELRRKADRVVCVRSPEPFIAIGLWYQEFAQLRDEQVRQLVEAARLRLAGTSKLATV